MEVGKEKLFALSYTDDVVLLARKEGEMRMMLRGFGEIYGGKKFGGEWREDEGDKI